MALRQPIPLLHCGKCVLTLSVSTAFVLILKISPFVKSLEKHYINSPNPPFSDHPFHPYCPPHPPSWMDDDFDSCGGGAANIVSRCEIKSIIRSRGRSQGLTARWRSASGMSSVSFIKGFLRCSPLHINHRCAAFPFSSLCA